MTFCWVIQASRSDQLFSPNVQACDSFAFGVLMWEMWHGVRAWSSLTFAQIITAVVANKKSLQFNADAPKDYADLANRCMHIDPTARPGFDEIVESLEHLQNIYPAQSWAPAKFNSYSF